MVFAWETMALDRQCCRFQPTSAASQAPGEPSGRTEPGVGVRLAASEAQSLQSIQRFAPTSFFLGAWDTQCLRSPLASRARKGRADGSVGWMIRLQIVDPSGALLHSPGSGSACASDVRGMRDITVVGLRETPPPCGASCMMKHSNFLQNPCV